MRKLVLLFFLFLLVACQNTNPSKEFESDKNPIPIYSDSSDDVVVKNYEIKNLDRFNIFLKNIENKTSDNIRIIRYTTEGDPMIKQLEYDGELIRILYDSKKDRYGIGKIEETVCTSIDIVENAKYTSFVLNQCDNNNEYVLLEISTQ